MSFELSLKDFPPSLILPGSISNLFDPLIKEIFLLDTFVAGTSHVKDARVFESLKREDALFLCREENEYDAMAILVLDRDHYKLGYVPKKDNLILARLMDGGKLLKGKVESVEKKGGYWKVEFKIFMMDF